MSAMRQKEYNVSSMISVFVATNSLAPIGIGFGSRSLCQISPEKMKLKQKSHTASQEFVFLILTVRWWHFHLRLIQHTNSSLDVEFTSLIPWFHFKQLMTIICEFTTWLKHPWKETGFVSFHQSKTSRRLPASISCIFLGTWMSRCSHIMRHTQKRCL